MATAKKKQEVWYLVIEDFTANINNKRMKGTRGEKIQLTPTELNVLKRFVMPI